jgi:hypothetical protein
MGAVDALWLKLFSGEVLTAYEQAKVLKPTVRVRTVSGQKSAQFPATFNAVGRYHTVGSEITGQAIKHNEIVITLDDLLISDVFVAQIDELKNHYDVRAPYAQALGRALALIEDRTIGQCIVAAARGAELVAGDGGGSSVIESDIVGTGDFDADGGDLISAVNLAKQKLDEKDVPVDTMTVNAAFRPAQWYLIANSDKNLNRDFGGQSTVGSQVLRTVADIQIRKSTALLFGFDASGRRRAAVRLPHEVPLGHHEHSWSRLGGTRRCLPAGPRSPDGVRLGHAASGHAHDRQDGDRCGCAPFEVCGRDRDVLIDA